MFVIPNKVQEPSFKYPCKIEGPTDLEVSFVFELPEKSASSFFLSWLLALVLTTLSYLGMKALLSLSQSSLAQAFEASLAETFGTEKPAENSHWLTLWLSNHLLRDSRALRQLQSRIASLQKLVSKQAKDLSKSEVSQAMLHFERKKNQEFIDHVSAVKHDIKGPLNSIMVYLGLKNTDPEQTKKNIRSLTKRLSAVVFDLEKIRSNYQTNTGTKTISIIEEAIADVIHEKQVLFQSRKDLEFKFNLRPEKKLTYVDIDSALFKRTLSNLIDNSADAIDSQGTIEISLNTDGVKLKMTIKDSGQGISDEVLPKLFDKGASFGKLNGEGLGLYMARKFLESENGSIEVESTSTKGTVMAIEIPYLVDRDNNSYSDLVDGKHSLLMIDDEPIYFDRIKEASNCLDYQQCLSPAEFMQAAKTIGGDNNWAFTLDYRLENGLRGTSLLDSRIVNKATIVTAESESLINCDPDFTFSVRVLPKSVLSSLN
jgi:signal transduction histidine kinase